MIQILSTFSVSNVVHYFSALAPSRGKIRNRALPDEHSTGFGCFTFSDIQSVQLC